MVSEKGVIHMWWKLALKIAGVLCMFIAVMNWFTHEKVKKKKSKKFSPNLTTFVLGLALFTVAQ
jgi:Kef-type K+ transport system membrane component KefB